MTSASVRAFAGSIGLQHRNFAQASIAMATIGLAALLPAPALAAQDSVRPGLGAADGFVRGATGVLRITLRRERSGFLSHAVLRASDPFASEGVEGAVELWRGGWSMLPAHSGEIAAAASAGKAFAAAFMIHGGATRFLQIWTGPNEALEGQPAHGDEQVQSFLLNELLLEPGVAPEADVPRDRARLIDLYEPVLVARGSDLLLLGTAHGDDRTWLAGSERVWILPIATALAGKQPAPLRVEEREEALTELFARPAAPLPLPLSDTSGPPRPPGPPTTPVAFHVADGTDPRALVRGEEVLVAVRQGKNLVETKGSAPVAFFRSTDLAAWELVPELQGLDARPSYDVAIAYDTLWLATPAGSGVELYRFDVEKEQWVRHESFAPEHARVREHGAGEPGERLWLFPRSDSDVRGLELVFTGWTGALERRLP